MKAIASGNPLVIEKATIDAEVLRFTRLKKQHADSQYQMRYQVKSLAESVQIAERQIAGIREDLRTRMNTRGDDFIMTVQNETFTDRAEAGGALVLLAAALKPFQTTKTIGSIAGFPITLQRSEARTKIIVHGRNTYEANVSEHALGTIASLERTLGSFEDQLRERETDLRQFRRQSDDLAAQVGKPFEHDAALAAAIARQQEIVAALDITKNQVSAKVDGGGEQLGGFAEVIQRSASRNGRVPSQAV